MNYNKNVEEEKTSNDIPEKLTALNAFEWLYDSSMGTAMSEEFMNSAQPVTKYIQDMYGITPEQAVMLSIVIAEFAMNEICDARKIAMHLNGSPFKSIPMSEELRKLRKKNILKTGNALRRTGFIPTKEFMEAIQENRSIAKHQLDNLSFDDMFIELRHIIKKACDDCNQEDSILNEVCDEIRDLFSLNQHLDFCRKVEDLTGSDNVQFFTFVYYCSHLVNLGHESMNLHNIALSRIIDDFYYTNLEHSLMIGSNELITSGLLEPVTETGMYDGNFRVTEKVRKELLYEYKPLRASHKNKLLYPDAITPKQLFYNPEIQIQLDSIEKMLSPDNYHNVVERLQQAGLRCGVAILLSGAAGTGKTEFVLQLARKTGRPIMQVNVTDIKDMFVGESEKRCINIWNNYNDLVSESDVEPILFLNEADQILGKRLENVTQSSDQMNNSLQNIMLENMERTNGIVICTTNLAQNLDSAFDRRFLFKVGLNTPQIQARREIWKSMIPQITDQQASYLAERYALSGAQVENISRKIIISSAIAGTSAISLEQSCSLCEQELSGPTTQNPLKIGF